MPYSQIQGELTDEQRTTVLAAITAIEESFEVLVNLTPLERRSIPKMGDLTYSFVAKAVDIAENNPQFVPSYVNAVGMTQDFNYSVAIREINQQLASLSDKLRGTEMAAGSEAYIVALALYDSLKTAAKTQVPGAGALRDKLASRFPRNSVTELPEEDPED